MSRLNELIQEFLKSRIQENCTYGSARGSRQAFHVEFMRGMSRLSTRLADYAPMYNACVYWNYGI